MPALSRAGTIIGCAVAVALTATAAAADKSVAQGKPRSDGGPQNGISLDTYYSLFPPLPHNVRAEIRGGKAVISWDHPPPPPAPPSGKLGYDPAVAQYRVYVLGPGAENQRLIGTTAGTTFTDPSRLRPGSTRRYGVTAVQRSGQESGMSNEAVLKVPRALR